MFSIDVHVAAGAEVATVRAGVEAAIAGLPAGADGTRPPVITGADARTQEAVQTVKDFQVLFNVIAMFIAIAVVAAALVATSTFRIVFAQRMRQLALLRVIGADRRQITRALIVEGALTGGVAGSIGVLAAWGAGQAIPWLLQAADVNIVAPGAPVLPALGVIGLAITVTVIAVLAPARSASRVAPLEALRDSATTTARSDIGTSRWVTGLGLTGVAALIIYWVLAQLPGDPAPVGYDPTPGLLAIVAAGAFIFFALIALGPVLVRPLLAVLGWPLRRWSKVGELAVSGVGGAARRAAAVSVVVALGATLIVAGVVDNASARSLLQQQLAADIPADFKINAGQDHPIPAANVRRAKADPHLTHVVAFRLANEVTARGTTTSSPVQVADLDLTSLSQLRDLKPKSGTLTGLGPGKAVIGRSAARLLGIDQGAVLPLSRTDHPISVTVAAVLPTDGPLGVDLLLDPSDLDRLGVGPAASVVLADAAGAGERGRTEGLQALKQAIQADVEVAADMRDTATKQLDIAFLALFALLSLTVIIAVVGVGTTTALSVVERVRESGLLRAVGLTRGGLRTMLIIEAGLHGTIGAAMGMLLGLPFAWLTLSTLGVEAPLITPVPELALVFVVFVVLTAVAGVLPARKAARVSPVAALSTDG